MVKNVEISEGWSVEKVDDPSDDGYGVKIMRITWNPSDGRKMQPSDLDCLENYDFRYVVCAESQEDQLTLLKYSGTVDNSFDNAGDIWKRGLKQYMDEKYEDVEFSLEEDSKGDFPRLKCYFSKRHLQSFDRSDFENHLRDCYINIGLKMFSKDEGTEDGSHDLLDEGARIKSLINDGNPPWKLSPPQFVKQRNCMRCYTDKQYGKRNKKALKYFSLPDMKTEYKQGSVEVLVGAAVGSEATAAGAGVGATTYGATAASIATAIPIWGWVLLGVVTVVAVAYTITQHRTRSIKVWRNEGKERLEIVFDPPESNCAIL